MSDSAFALWRRAILLGMAVALAIYSGVAHAESVPAKRSSATGETAPVAPPLAQPTETDPVDDSFPLTAELPLPLPPAAAPVSTNKPVVPPIPLAGENEPVQDAAPAGPTIIPTAPPRQPSRTVMPYEPLDDGPVIIPRSKVPPPTAYGGPNIVSQQEAMATQYKAVHDAIPFNRSLYEANPTYRHELATGILFGNLPATAYRQGYPVKPQSGIVHNPKAAWVPQQRDLLFRRYVYYPYSYGFGFSPFLGLGGALPLGGGLGPGVIPGAAGGPGAAFGGGGAFSTRPLTPFPRVYSRP